MTKTKKCTKCGKRKRRAQFTKDRSKKDGLQAWCKACQGTYHKAWARTPEGRASHRKADAKRSAKYPEKLKARAAAKYHVPLAGNCEVCGGFTALQRHHPDYDQPLDVVTVCRRCHFDIHNRERGAA